MGDGRWKKDVERHHDLTEARMEILGTILGTAGTVASGGILGLFGGIVGGIFKFFKARQEHQFKRDEWAHELALQELENARSREEDEHELAIVAQEGSWGSLKTSLERQASVGESYRWVNAIKDLFRPFLTAGLFVMTWFIFVDTIDLELRKYIIYSVVFTASTAGMWWFADRALAPPGTKNR